MSCSSATAPMKLRVHKSTVNSQCASVIDKYLPSENQEIAQLVISFFSSRLVMRPSNTILEAHAFSLYVDTPLFLGTRSQPNQVFARLGNHLSIVELPKSQSVQLHRSLPFRDGALAFRWDELYFANDQGIFVSDVQNRALQPERSLNPIPHVTYFDFTPSFLIFANNKGRVFLQLPSLWNGVTKELDTQLNSITFVGRSRSGNLLVMNGAEGPLRGQIQIWDTFGVGDPIKMSINNEERSRGRYTDACLWDDCAVVSVTGQPESLHFYSVPNCELLKKITTFANDEINGLFPFHEYVCVLHFNRTIIDIVSPKDFTSVFTATLSLPIARPFFEDGQFTPIVTSGKTVCHYKPFASPK